MGLIPGLGVATPHFEVEVADVFQPPEFKVIWKIFHSVGLLPNIHINL
jgi:hypothetical protein